MAFPACLICSHTPVPGAVHALPGLLQNAWHVPPMHVRPTAHPDVAVQGEPIGALPALTHSELPCVSVTSHVCVGPQPHCGATPHTLLGAAFVQPGSTGVTGPPSPVGFDGDSCCVVLAVSGGDVEVDDGFGSVVPVLVAAVVNGVRDPSELHATIGKAIASVASDISPTARVPENARFITTPGLASRLRSTIAHEAWDEDEIANRTDSCPRRRTHVSTSRRSEKCLRSHAALTRAWCPSALPKSTATSAHHLGPPPLRLRSSGRGPS